MSAKTGSEDNQEASLNNLQEADNAQTNSKTRSRRSFLGKVTAATVGAGLISKLGVEALGQFQLPADSPGGGDATACPVGCEEGPLKGLPRAQTAHQRRISAADYEFNMPIPSHPCNGDETTFGAAVNFFASYSKGMPHPSIYGEVDPSAYCTYKRALISGRPSDFELIPLGCGACEPSTAISESESRLAPPEAAMPPEQRRLANPQAGYNFDLEGKDYHQLINRLPSDSFPCFLQVPE